MRLTVGRRARQIIAGLTVLVALTAADAQAGGDWQQRWQATLPGYVADPWSNRRAMLALARSAPEELTAMQQLIIADAYLRSGRARSAAALFERVYAEHTGEEPWASSAALGAGWAALQTGRVDDARGYFASAEAVPGEGALVAAFLGAQLAARSGDVQDALDAFDRIGEHPLATEELRSAADLAGGYARLWSGDESGAREAFEAVAARAGTLADDAQYAAAITQWKVGDTAGAEQSLAALAAAAASSTPPPGTRSLAPSLRSSSRAAWQLYRKAPLGRRLQQQLVGTIDLDAERYATVALRRLRAGEPPPSALDFGVRPRSAATTNVGHEARSRVELARGGHAVVVADTSSGPASLVRLIVGLVLLGLIGLAARRAGLRRDPRRAIDVRRA
jgi:hypothetical protein